jgi:hypothetical protein
MGWFKTPGDVDERGKGLFWGTSGFYIGHLFCSSRLMISLENDSRIATDAQIGSC